MKKLSFLFILFMGFFTSMAQTNNVPTLPFNYIGEDESYIMSIDLPKMSEWTCLPEIMADQNTKELVNKRLFDFLQSWAKKDKKTGIDFTGKMVITVSNDSIVRLYLPLNNMKKFKNLLQVTVARNMEIKKYTSSFNGQYLIVQDSDNISFNKEIAYVEVNLNNKPSEGKVIDNQAIKNMQIINRLDGNRQRNNFFTRKYVQETFANGTGIDILRYNISPNGIKPNLFYKILGSRVALAQWPNGITHAYMDNTGFHYTQTYAGTEKEFQNFIRENTVTQYVDANLIAHTGKNPSGIYFTNLQFVRTNMAKQVSNDIFGGLAEIPELEKILSQNASLIAVESTLENCVLITYCPDMNELKNCISKLYNTWDHVLDSITGENNLMKHQSYYQEKDTNGAHFFSITDSLEYDWDAYWELDSVYDENDPDIEAVFVEPANEEARIEMEDIIEPAAPAVEEEVVEEVVEEEALEEEAVILEDKSKDPLFNLTLVWKDNILYIGKTETNWNDFLTVSEPNEVQKKAMENQKSLNFGNFLLTFASFSSLLSDLQEEFGDEPFCEMHSRIEGNKYFCDFRTKDCGEPVLGHALKYILKEIAAEEENYSPRKGHDEPVEEIDWMDTKVKDVKEK